MTDPSVTLDDGKNIQENKAKGMATKNVESHANSIRPGFFVKLILMGIVNAFGVYVIMQAYAAESWGILVAMVLALVVLDYIYFSKRALAAKYLAPGIFFLLVFQIFVIFYTGYIAFTNYGTGHNIDKSAAIERNLERYETRIPDSPSYPLAVIQEGDVFGFAIIDGEEVKAGLPERPLEVIEDAEFDGSKITSVPGYEIRTDIFQIPGLTDLRVPVSDEAEDGSIRTQTGSNGYLYRSIMSYDPDTDQLTNNETGVVYEPNDRGSFVNVEDPNDELSTGWPVPIGFDNFTNAFGDSRYAQPFLKVLLWTFAFAFLSVFTTFVLGMFFALVMNDERMKGRRWYRTAMLLPYAFPSFLTALLFAGLLNTRFGFINATLLGGADIPWLTDPWLAKISVLLVNLWMGFPYMFLIVTGALQAIPKELVEAAKVDGATGMQVWRHVTLPQILVATTPLLISSFAFNFNNFNLIYMLTDGGPRMSDASVPVGHTDILISMVYKIAGIDGGATTNYGLASAMSIVIFIIVASISAYSFKKSNSFEGIG